MRTQASMRFHEVDVLRGLAALAVVFSHYLPHWDHHYGDLAVVVPGGAGYIAVKLFFVISGFVIFMTLERCTSVLDFAVLRFSRLYPAYWAAILVVTLIAVFVFDDLFWLGGFAANATMLQQFLGYPHLDNVFWSLTVELAFYVHVAWLFALGLHRRIERVLFAWLLLALIWILATQPIGQVTASGVVDTSQRSWPAMLFAFDYAPYFAVGIVLYRVRRSGWGLPAAALIAFAVAVELLLASWEGLAVVVAASLLFWLAIHGYLRFLVARPLLWLGAISYSLYLSHRNLSHHVLEWMHAHDVHAVVAIAATLAGALLLASALTYGVERPASRRLRTWYRQRQARSTGGSRDGAGAAAIASGRESAAE